MKDNRTKIFIAEDYPLFIEALKSKIYAYSTEFDFVGHALNGEEAIKEIEGKEVDILILDIGMPKINGLDVLKHVTVEYPHIKVLVLTMYGDFKHIREMLKAGAKGYILKNTIGKNVIQALREIRDGGDYLQEEVAQVGARGWMKDLTNKNYSDKELIIKSLKDYEIELLGLITLELTGKEIADRMNVSPKTIETWCKNLRMKLQVEKNVGLAMFAAENGFKQSKE